MDPYCVPYNVLESTMNKKTDNAAFPLIIYNLMGEARQWTSKINILNHKRFWKYYERNKDGDEGKEEEPPLDRGDHEKAF